MAKVKIVRPDGTPSPYFWDNKDKKEAKAALKIVYKKTDDGVKRLRGVRYDLARNTFQKD